MRQLISILLLPALAVALLPSTAEAHILDSAGAGLGAGLAHPFSGLDHLLAMIAVGVWAVQIAQGGKRWALWLLPVAFPLAMALGGVLGAAGLGLPFVEAGIGGSVAVLGLLIMLAVRPQPAVAAAVVVVFALFHGHAHGTELPEAASPVLYGLGFIAATTILHAIGLGLGTILRQPFGAVALRAGGAVIAVAGIGLLAAV